MRRVLAGLFLGLVLPIAAFAAGPYTDDDITLEYYYGNRIPYIHSFARSILYNTFNVRIYDAQLILGHQVSHEQLPIFNATVISDIGYANSSTGLGRKRPYCCFRRLL